ncbi:MAG: hypothetical protein AMJ79_00190 [Phycisphaerae bacterium SM23_30]|nr:MAG: hypothetical protein AMJ79_00190 [Phycisphaerae bacterium SM23_30]
MYCNRVYFFSINMELCPESHGLFYRISRITLPGMVITSRSCFLSMMIGVCTRQRNKGPWY